MIIELYSQNNSLFSSSKIPFIKIENQDENEINLEFLNNKGEKVSLLVKLTLIWSYYKLFQDKYTETEINLAELKTILDRRMKVLETLLDPFKFISGIGNNTYSRAVGNNYNVNNAMPTGIFSDYSAQDKTEFKIADKVENIVKNTLSKYFLI